MDNPPNYGPPVFRRVLLKLSGESFCRPGEGGLSVDEISKIADRYPNIRFVIDHMNLFVEDRGDVVTQAVTTLLPLARHPNIAVKVSALPAHSTEAYPFRDMHPHIERVLQAFGPTRTFWGTDLTRRACTYEQAISMFTEELPFMKEQQLKEVMGEAALRWIGW